MSLLDKIQLTDIQSIAQAAGEVIMEIYNKDFQVDFKNDASPITLADKKAHEVIEQGLNQLTEKYGLTENIPILSEEGAHLPYETRKNWVYYWLVDPLDGTKEFVKKNGEFTVNIALMHHNQPVLGVVYAPVLGDMYLAKKGEGAFKNQQPLPLVNAAQASSYNIVASRSHLSAETQAYIDAIHSDKPKQLLSIGSSLKLCMVAEGAANIYPRLGPTMEWDTAAAHAIVLEAGMHLEGYTPQTGYFPHLYNKPNLLNGWFVVYQTKP